MDRFLTPLHEASDMIAGGNNGGIGKRHGLSHPLPVLLLTAQVEGRMQPSQKQALVVSTLPSYSEVGKAYQLEPITHENMGIQFNELDHNFPTLHRPDFFSSRPYISCLQFDSKGVYVASVTSTGSLVIHDYESLYCHAGSKSGSVAPVVQLSSQKKLEAIRWNPHNQDEVACIAGGTGRVFCYDISRITDKASEVLMVNPTKGKKQETFGLFDISYCKLSEKRVLACGRDGEIHVWDRRVCRTSMCPFFFKQYACLNTLALSEDEQVVYVGSTTGLIHAWDFRGGRSSAAFLTPGQVYNPPFATWKINVFLRLIPALLAQTEIETSGIQSIGINPCCQQQLAFHLNNGWSGVLDLLSLKITHVHCPPPPWIYNERGQESVVSATTLRRRPTWLPTTSVYACGSSSSSKITFLDFGLGTKSSHHVEANRSELVQSHFDASTSEVVVACTAHPLNDDIVAGTEVTQSLTSSACTLVTYIHCFPYAPLFAREHLSLLSDRMVIW